MYSDVYFAIGLLVGLVFALAIAAIIACLPATRQRETRKPPGIEPMSSPTLGELRVGFGDLQHRLNELIGHVSSYGISEERKSREWRLLSMAIAQKTSLALQSYWMESRSNPEVKSLYHELLQSLRSLGMREILPQEGQTVDENDGRFRFNSRSGTAPLLVERVVCPGFALDLSRQRNLDDGEGFSVVLEPAIVDVHGRDQTTA